MADKRVLLIAGGAALLGAALFMTRGDDAEGTPGIAAAHAGGGGSDDAPGEAKRPGSEAARAAAKGGDKAGGGADSWNPGGEHEPTADDAQQWHWLQQDLDRMIDNTRPKARKRLAPEAFRDEYLAATLKYLQLEDAERTKFEAAAAGALTSISTARSTLQTAQEDTPYDEDDPDSIEAWKDAQATFKDQQAEAADQLLAAIPQRARTTMLREDALRWVVRYDFGLQHAARAASR